MKGSQRPEQALQSLNSFEAKLARLKEDRDNIVKAKDALELGDALASPLNERLSIALEELQDLKGVWDALTPIYNQLEEFKDKPWLSIQPRKLRQGLDGLLGQLKDLPAKFRSYDGYEYVKRLLQGYTKVKCEFADA